MGFELPKIANSRVWVGVVFLILTIVGYNYVSFLTALQIKPSSITTSGLVKYPSIADMWLHTTSTHILNSKNDEVIWNGINSRSLFGYWIDARNGKLEEYLHTTDIQAIRSHGLNFVRVWIALNQAVYNQPMGTPTHLNYYPRFWTLLDEIVNATAQSGMWLSIDFHLSDGTWANIGGAFGDGSGFPSWMYNGSWSYFNKIYPNTLEGRTAAIRDFWNTSDATAANVRLAFRTFWKDIVARYDNSPNVLFSMFNEPMYEWDGPNLYPVPSYSTPSTAWKKQIAMYQGFMENQVDTIRGLDGGKHVIIINQAGLPSHNWNPQIRRPNIVVEDHYYGTDLPNHIQYYAQNAWRYNQPFELGEFGGVEHGSLQSEAEAILSMQTANSLGIGWSYLWYDLMSFGGCPSAKMWIDLQNSLLPNLEF